MTPPGRLLDGLTGEHRALAGSAAAIARSLGFRLAIVGGAVRDLLLGLRVGQLDLMAGEDRPAPREVWPGIAIARAFAREHSARLSEHPRFGTAVVLLAGGESLDFASAREETYPAPGALPDVRPAPFERDLARRDFSVNALAIPLGGRPLAGEGASLGDERALEDMHARRLRVLHPASFRDDPTRLFRGARFAARLGFSLEEGTAHLFREAVTRDGEGSGFVDLLSPARLRHEIERFLLEQGPVGTARALDRSGLLGCIERRLGIDDARERLLSALEGGPAGPGGPAEKTLSPLVLWLGAMTIDASPREEPARPREARPDRSLPASLALRLGLDGPSSRRLDRIGTEVTGLLSAADGAGTQQGFVQLCAAYELAGTESRRLARAVDPSAAAWLDRAAQALLSRRPVLSGQDLMTLGLPEGPAIGRILGLIAGERLAGTIETPEQERTLAARLVAGELDSPGGAGKTRVR